MTKQKRAAAYLDAAQQINEGVTRFCCVAIDIACNADIDVRTMKEFFLFKPENIQPSFRWWNEINEESQSERVLALLFSHQMALNP